MQAVGEIVVGGGEAGDDRGGGVGDDGAERPATREGIWEGGE